MPRTERPKPRDTRYDNGIKGSRKLPIEKSFSPLAEPVSQSGRFIDNPVLRDRPVEHGDIDTITDQDVAAYLSDRISDPDYNDPVLYYKDMDRYRLINAEE